MPATIKINRIERIVTVYYLFCTLQQLYCNLSDLQRKRLSASQDKQTTFFFTYKRNSAFHPHPGVNRKRPPVPVPIHKAPSGAVVTARSGQTSMTRSAIICPSPARPMR
jgi:hypothetical protein